MSAMTKKEWMEYLEKTWDAAQKEAWSDPQFECPRCGHCCKSDLARVGEVGVWGEWQGLTDEQVEDEWERITQHSIFGGDRSEGRAMYISPDEVIQFSRAIEAKLKEKNHG